MGRLNGEQFGLAMHLIHQKVSVFRFFQLAAHSECNNVDTKDEKTKKKSLFTLEYGNCKVRQYVNSERTYTNSHACND